MTSENNKCPKCNSNMITKPPDRILTSYPPKWHCIMWCGCGHEEDRGLVSGDGNYELIDLWKAENSNTIDC